MKNERICVLSILERLMEFKDHDYAVFQQKLTPTISLEHFIGVRVPDIRKLAKEYVNLPETKEFLKDLPHRYYDENMLHAAIISEMKDYTACMNSIEEFLPYVDNWAVCDTMIPKVFKKHREELLVKLKEWCVSKHTYTCRYSMRMLMAHFLDEDFKAEYLVLPAAVRSSEYYVNMMTAWFFATALAKQWDATIPYIENNRLDVWTHNKTITKSCESFRVTQEHKEYLRSLKR